MSVAIHLSPREAHELLNKRAKRINALVHELDNQDKKHNKSIAEKNETIFHASNYTKEFFKKHDIIMKSNLKLKDKFYSVEELVHDFYLKIDALNLPEPQYQAVHGS